jgi:hypothetical protein
MKHLTQAVPDILTKQNIRIRFGRALIAGLLAIGASACSPTIITTMGSSGSSAGGASGESQVGVSGAGESSGSASGGAAGASAAGASAAAGSTSVCAGAGAGEANPADFPGQITSAFCSVLSPCCAAAQLPFDEAACEAYVGSEFQYDVSRIGNGIAFDCAAAQRCLAELSSAIRGCNAYDKAQLPDCNHILVGTLPVGSTCAESQECAAPLDVSADCSFNVGGVTGKCTLAPSAPRGKQGDICGESCDPYGSCAIETGDPPPIVSCYQSDGLYCSDARTCAAIGGVGASCSSEQGCAPGVLCLDSAGTPLTPYVPPLGHCGSPSPNGLLANPYLCLGRPNPNQD